MKVSIHEVTGDRTRNRSTSRPIERFWGRMEQKYKCLVNRLWSPKHTCEDQTDAIAGLEVFLQPGRMEHPASTVANPIAHDFFCDHFPLHQSYINHFITDMRVSRTPYDTMRTQMRSHRFEGINNVMPRAAGIYLVHAAAVPRISKHSEFPKCN